MADFLYYWKLFGSDTAKGPIYKLNQNSTVMSKIRPGDDLWAIGRVGGAYVLLSRMTIVETGVNPSSSADSAKYGRFFARSSQALANFPPTDRDIEQVIRSLSIKCDADVLGLSFQGHAAVRKLTDGDRAKLIAFAGQLQAT